MPSPLCSIKNGGAAYVPAIPRVAVTPGNTIIIKLDTPAGVGPWEIECYSTDELSSKSAVNASLIIDQAAKTATFTAPVTGRAYLFRSRVQNGLNNGKEDPSYSSFFKVFTATAGAGLEVGAVGEQTEGDPTFGWLSVQNALIRNGGAVSDAGSGNKGVIQLAADLAGNGGTAAAPRVSGMTGDAGGKVTHAETYHELLTANHRLRDERFALNPLTAGPDLLWSMTIPTGESWVVDYELVAHVIGGGSTNLYRATRKIKNVGGALTVTTIGTDVSSEDLAGTIDYTTTGTTVRLRYTRPAASWAAVGRVTINGAVA